MIDSDVSLNLSAEEKRLLDKTPDADRESRLQALLDKLELIAVTPVPDSQAQHALQGAYLALEIAGLLLDLDRKVDAWGFARPTVEVFVANAAF